MVSRNAEVPQGDGGMTSTNSFSVDQLRSRQGSNTVFKSGPLLISSKGLGWTSWKKRWFILTRTSLVFYRSDPNAPSQKGSEANSTLGGIDLNSSGSVIVRADKKLLTVLFPGGRDGRTFTLKAETSEDMYEWKTALESALAQAPNATHVMSQTGILRNDAADATEGSSDQWHKKPVKSLVVGRPILLALEDIDGNPSFLEKALTFMEECGIKVEGILRQAADVEEVERRVREYEQGKDEFSPDEDAHVVADCIKHILRELPTSPVPAACCTALLEAFRSERALRINAMRSVVFEKFPEPNRRLLQRILKMMRTVVAHKAENRMSTSAVAACMAPLLLRPLLAGDCQFEDDFQMGGDGSLQLLQAAAAANHAQAIVITLLEEYHNIFSDASFTSEIYTDSEGSYTEDEEYTDDEILDDDEYDDHDNDLYSQSEDDPDRQMSGRYSGSSGIEDTDSEYSKEDDTGSAKCLKIEEYFEGNENTSGEKDPPAHLDVKDFEVIDLGTESPEPVKDFEPNEKPSMRKDILEDNEKQVPKDNEKQMRENNEIQVAEDDEKQLSERHNSKANEKQLAEQCNSEADERPLAEQHSCAADDKIPMEQQNLLAHENTASSNTYMQSVTDKSPSTIDVGSPESLENMQVSANATRQCHLHSQPSSSLSTSEVCEASNTKSSQKAPHPKGRSLNKSSSINKSTKKSNDATGVKRHAIWGRTAAKKNLSMEAVDIPNEDEIEIQKLEFSKADLEKKIMLEAEENALLQETLERHRKSLNERRVALEKEVIRLQEQLQKERDLRASLEAGLGLISGPPPNASNIDSKTRAKLEEVTLAEADVANLKEKVSNLHQQLNQERQINHSSNVILCGHDQNISKDVMPWNHKNDCSPRTEDLLPGADCKSILEHEMPLSSNIPPTDKQQNVSSSQDTIPVDHDLDLAREKLPTAKLQTYSFDTKIDGSKLSEHPVSPAQEQRQQQQESGFVTDLPSVENAKSAILTADRSNSISNSACPFEKSGHGLSKGCVSRRQEQSQEQEVDLAAVPQIIENAKSAVPKADPSSISKSKSGHLFDTNSSKSLECSVSLSHKQSQEQLEMGQTTDTPIDMKAKYVVSTDDPSSLSKSMPSEHTSEPSNASNLESSVLTLNPLSEDNLKSAEGTSDLSSVSSPCVPEPITDPLVVDKRKSAELTTVLSCNKNLKSAEDTSDLSSAQSNRDVELTCDPSSLNNPKSSKFTKVLSSEKNLKSAQLTDDLSSEKNLKSAGSAIDSLREELPFKENESDPSDVKGPESIAETVGGTSEDKKSSTDELQPNGMPQDLPSSTNKLPSKNCALEDQKSSINELQSSGTSQDQSSSTNKSPPKNTQAESSVNNPKRTTNNTANDPPPSTDKPSLGSLSSNDNSKKAKKRLPGSTSDGSTTAVREASSQKSTEASNSLSKAESLPVKSATSSKRSKGSRLSNDDPSKSASVSSSKKSSGKEGNSSTISRITNRFNFRKDRRSKSVDLQNYEFHIEGPFSDVPEPTAPPGKNS
ncbi:hypothetical protein H6P81_010757 [Aristolochia fimbriata]|uniref:Rho GTPase-activating protein REN1-like n=1 Tax=Aristolochia fimbriata TaxID=158543 RepID=A0AAV7ET21_ARIFI|nr:hypothetical protein H6P81_010757 [Aristolochia fimbriata]